MRSQWCGTENANNSNFTRCRFRASQFFQGYLVFLLLLAGCTGTEETRVPARELYYKATVALEDELFNEATERLTQIIGQSPGTRLATVAYLKLGDLYFQQNKWEEAETNYRLFLALNPNSHLTPYVLNRLIALNYKRNVTGLLFTSRDFDRDMEPNRKIIQEYQRFFFLYPNNAYLTDVKEFLIKARSDLAEYEFLVANFYFEQQAFNSAILRYLHLLKHYPEYPKTQEVGIKLIEAYEANRQPHLAAEMRKALEVRFNQKNLN